MRVLLVEDDPMIDAAIQAALKDESYAADWVKGGHTALSTLECHYCDLVLPGLGLPGKDGLDVLAAIHGKRNPACPALSSMRQRGQRTGAAAVTVYSPARARRACTGVAEAGWTRADSPK